MKRVMIGVLFLIACPLLASNDYIVDVSHQEMLAMFSSMRERYDEAVDRLEEKCHGELNYESIRFLNAEPINQRYVAICKTQSFNN